MTSTAKHKYVEFKKTFETAKAEMQRQAKDAFREMAADLFVDYPILESFAFTQYAPYFNDGEECIFSVHTDADSLYLNGKSLDYGSDTDEAFGNLDYAEREELWEEHYARPAKAVSEFLQLFDDATMQEMFGNHVSVTIHRDGRAETEEYDHD